MLVCEPLTPPLSAAACSGGGAVCCLPCLAVLPFQPPSSPGTPPAVCSWPHAARRAAPPVPAPRPAPGSSPVDRLPAELLGAIVEAALQDDAQQQRRPVLQFTGRAWLAAYRAAAFRSVSIDVCAALRLQQRRGLSEAAAAAAVVAGLAARLPYAEAVDICGMPAEGGFYCSARVARELRWQLGELLLRMLGGSTRLRRLSCDYLPHLPMLLAARAARGLDLRALGVTSLPCASLLAQLPLLAVQPLHTLALADAAGLPDREAEALARALPCLRGLEVLCLGGSGASQPDASSMGASGAADEPESSGCLPSLALVAAAAAIPGLLQLELSLTFGKRHSPLQQEYLHRLGCVLHSQRRQHEAALAAASCAAAAAAAGAHPAAAAAVGEAGGCGSGHSRVSVTVHEHMQGDLSAVPVASCSLNLDWDDESNPIEVWQCSTLRQLRIAAQLPVHAGQFRPARLAALETLQIMGCCHIPAYFAQALCSMQQLSVLKLSDCLLEAVAAVPWHQVLPRLASLRDVAVERCHGAVVLHSLWAGLAGCSRLEALSITGSAAGGGLPEAAGSLRLPSADLLLPPACRCFEAALPGQAPSHRASCPQAAGSVPPTVALLQHLRRLDLSGNGLAALPDALAYCQQLTAVRLAGNRLQGVPVGLAALGGLRHLDLSANQLCSLPAGPYLHQLEELRLGANLLLRPAGLPLQLLQRRSLRLLGLPLWWQLAGDEGLAALLLALCPWLLLEHS